MFVKGRPGGKRAGRKREGSRRADQTRLALFILPSYTIESALPRPPPPPAPPVERNGTYPFTSNKRDESSTQRSTVCRVLIVYTGILLKRALRRAASGIHLRRRRRGGFRASFPPLNLETPPLTPLRLELPSNLLIWLRVYY